MALNDDSALRALIRLIPPARALRDDLQNSLHMDTYAGSGDLALQSFMGLRDSVLAITNDPLIAALNISPRPEASDQEKVSLARLAAGQVAAFLEGQTGLIGGGGNNEGPHINIQRAPSINLVNVHGLTPETLGKITDTAKQTEEAS